MSCQLEGASVVLDVRQFLPAPGIGRLWAVVTVIPESGLMTDKQTDALADHRVQSPQPRHPCRRTAVKVGIRITDKNTTDGLFAVDPVCLRRRRRVLEEEKISFNSCSFYETFLPQETVLSMKSEK